MDIKKHNCITNFKLELLRSWELPASLCLALLPVKVSDFGTARNEQSVQIETSITENPIFANTIKKELAEWAVIGLHCVQALQNLLLNLDMEGN